MVRSATVHMIGAVEKDLFVWGGKPDDVHFHKQTVLCTLDWISGATNGPSTPVVL